MTFSKAGNINEKVVNDRIAMASRDMASLGENDA